MKVPLKSLLPFSPFDHPVWTLNTPIRKTEVAKAIEAKSFHPDPIPAPLDPGFKRNATRKEHVARVAYLVVNPRTEPLDIDVGVPSLGLNIDWIIQDGHHRLAAAIYRGDAEIDIEFSGSVDLAEEIFGVKIPWEAGAC